MESKLKEEKKQVINELKTSVGTSYSINEFFPRDKGVLIAASFEESIYNLSLDNYKPSKDVYFKEFKVTGFGENVQGLSINDIVCIKDLHLGTEVKVNSNAKSMKVLHDLYNSMLKGTQSEQADLIELTRDVKVVTVTQYFIVKEFDIIGIIK